MKSHPALILCALCFMTIIACQNQGRDLVMKTKIAQLTLAKNNFTVDRATREKNMDSVAKKLSEEYPAAPPFGRDSTARIFFTQMPPVIDGIPFDEKKYEYESPPSDLTTQKIFGTSRFQDKKYFGGSVVYLKKGKKVRGRDTGRAIAIYVRDAGNMPEWAVTWIFDQLFSGSPGTFFPSLSTQFELEKTVDYKGHTWAVWVPSERSKKMLERNLQGNLVFFTTQWNSRFMVSMVDIDTSAAKLETFYKVVDVEWLDKLRSAERR